MLTVGDQTHPHAPAAADRSAELTRPLRLGRLAIVTGIAVTAGMIGILGLGIGRDSDATIFRRELSSLEDPTTPIDERRIIGLKPSIRSALERDGLRAQQMIGRDVLVIRARPGADAGRAVIRNLRTGKETQVIADDVVEIRRTQGHLVFVRPDGTLWAAPFDERRNRIAAVPQKIDDSVSLTGTGSARMIQTSGGFLAYVKEGMRSLVLVSRGAKLRPLVPERRIYSNPRFSPDGNRIAVDFYDGDGRDVWTVDVNGGPMERATFQGDAHDAAWTPDSKSITYTSFRLGTLGIYRAQPGVRNSVDSLFTAGLLVYSGEWLKDGSAIVAVASDVAPQSRLDIVSIGNRGRGPVTPVIANRFETRFPVVSPNGKWLAYVSNDTGADEVYIRPLDGGASVRLSLWGGTEPVWSSDGRELFYRDVRSQYLMAASVRADSNLVLVDKRRLFPIEDMVPGFTHANYDVSPDGATFVMIRRSIGQVKLLNLSDLARDPGTR